MPALRPPARGDIRDLNQRGRRRDGGALDALGAFRMGKNAHAASGSGHDPAHGLELAGVYGRLSAQSEAFKARVNRNSGVTDVDFDGWYAQTGYFLTGESRPYNVSTGTFGRVKPAKPFNLRNNDWGAWEIVGRYSNTDLNDSGAGITGLLSISMAQGL